MADRFHRMLSSLRDPLRSRRAEALLALENEWSAQDVDRFSGWLEEQNASICVELCPVLAGTSHRRLVEVLCRYLARGTPALRDSASDALAHVRGHLRVPALTALLESREPSVRLRACELLGTAGSLGPKSALVQRLRDPEPNVVLAALKALQRLNCRDITEHLAALLDRPETDVRLKAVEMLVDLSPEGAFPTGRLTGLLAEDTAKDVRMAALWALGHRPSPKGRRVLLDLLTGHADAEVRAGAAASLGAFEDEEVAATLLRAAAHDTDVQAFLSSKRALGGMDPHMLGAVCRQMLNETDAALRRQTAALLGELPFLEAARLLADRLSVEKDKLVRAAIIEALGHTGGTEVWTIVRSAIGEDPVVAYAAASALANLLDDDHLQDFIGLLAELQDETLREVVLKRLSLYGRAKGLPPHLCELVVPLLQSDQRNVAVLAAEAAGRVHVHSKAAGAARKPPTDETHGAAQGVSIARERHVAATEVAAPLFEAMARSDDSEFKRVAASSLRQLFQGDLRALIDAAEPDHLGEAAQVLSTLDMPPDDGAELCRHLAALAHRGLAPAADALQAVARLDPASLASSLADCGPERAPILLRAWRELAPEQKRQTSLARRETLQSAVAEVRLAALLDVGPGTSEQLLPLIVDMSLRDRSKEVRRTAREALKRIVEA